MKAKLTPESNQGSARYWSCGDAGSPIQGHNKETEQPTQRLKNRDTSTLCIKVEGKLHLGMAALDNLVEGNVVEHLG